MRPQSAALPRSPREAAPTPPVTFPRGCDRSALTFPASAHAIRGASGRCAALAYISRISGIQIRRPDGES
jgi:hypothetical protein